ncbi:hypothetical protein PHET_09211 [Paragonimus heterotremus]|uniref:Uncharacterized protein n=1 Tax=Paragonimus heterotremus TaxID=100268 RepID=A0A8J4SV52_9TREM|nr:hypothetical protein PHET_09211 [Paragonimus heterotremus]
MFLLQGVFRSPLLPYPFLFHFAEVVRTRLREAHGHYRGLVGTVRKVTREEGLAGLYRGMGTHYIRQVPNSCIMIGTYEMVVFLIQSWGLSKTS